MKTKLRKLKCKLFGHSYFEEVYCEQTDRLYQVRSKTTCSCCGEYRYNYLTRHLTRTELLKQGWFLTKLN